jgi:hypothetical protein
VSPSPPGIARAVVCVVAAAVTAEIVRVGAGVSGAALATAWQLLDLDVLEQDPAGAVWYLHTQPPLYNAVVGLVAWSPLPLAGTLFVLYAGCLVALGLLLLDLLGRWDVGIVVATAVACLAMANPALLGTIRNGSYEVPLATMLVLLVWAVDHYMTTSARRHLALVVATGTALVLTRALFHPAWLLIVLAVVLLARPPARRHVVICVVVPVVVVGAWVGKNAVLFDAGSLSSWTGFNLHRGVLGPMDEASVDAAVADGAVSDLATEAPWQPLSRYAPWLGECRPRHAHPAVSAPEKQPLNGIPIANYNHECFLMLYRSSRDDALTMVRREPGQYLATRGLAVMISHAYAQLGTDDEVGSLLGDQLPTTSWMDWVYSPLLLRVGMEVDMSDWNVSLFGDVVRYSVVLPLLAITLFVLVRTTVAVVRCWRAVRGRAPPPGFEVVWVVAGLTIAVVVLGGDLVELGENQRFRSMVDPLALALVATELVKLVDRRRARTS